jgi:hypothetical protein
LLPSYWRAVLQPTNRPHRKPSRTKSVSVNLEVTDTLCQPGTARGTALLSGPVAAANLTMHSIVEGCTDQTLKAKATVVRSIKGQIAEQRSSAIRGIT